MARDRVIQVQTPTLVELIRTVSTSRFRPFHKENAESASGKLEAHGELKVIWNENDYIEALQNASDIDSQFQVQDERGMFCFDHQFRLCTPRYPPPSCP